MKTINLTTKVEFLKGELKNATNEAKSQGILANFKVFHQLMLQLHPDFDMEALKAFVTPEVVVEAIIEVEEEVVATHESISKVMHTSSGGVSAEVETRVEVLNEVEDANGS